MTVAVQPLATALFDYQLPPDLIAQAPIEPRDAARLLVLDRASGALEHRQFRDLPELLWPGDLLALNRTRVIPARLQGTCRGRPVEVLLLRRRAPGRWETLVRPGRRLPPGASIVLANGLVGEILSRTRAGGRLVAFHGHDDPDGEVARQGTVPLPPYIRGWTGDPERYQTVYGDTPGSVAAPTAGLHFTPAVFDRLRERGVRVAYVLLHVGLDTFRPVRVDDLLHHEIHRELCEVPAETAAAIQATRAGGGRVVAVGTTTVRALETAGQASAPDGSVRPWSGETGLYILPGHRFRVVDAMVTNFHLPRSTLLALVSAFAGRERILAAYDEAVRCRYRFFSFGDAMLVL